MCFVFALIIGHNHSPSVTSASSCSKIRVSNAVGNSRNPLFENSYLLGSYRIAIAPDPNSTRLTSFKSIDFASPANNVGPCPAILGCTTNSYSSINPNSANGQRQLHATHEQSPARLPLELLNGFPQIPAQELRVPIHPAQRARHDVFLCRIDRPGERFHPIGPRSRLRRRPKRCLHHLINHPAKQKRIRPFEILDRMTMQLFVRYNSPMITAPVQSDINGIPKRSHPARVRRCHTPGKAIPPHRPSLKTPGLTTVCNGGFGSIIHHPPSIHRRRPPCPLLIICVYPRHLRLNPLFCSFEFRISVFGFQISPGFTPVAAATDSPKFASR